MRREDFGATANGVPVHSFRLESASGVSVRVMEYGASIVSIEVPDRHARRVPIVLGFDELAPYLRAEPKIGATLGRYAGCISDAAFQLSGSLHALSKNCGAHHVHGGEAGLHSCVWWGEALGDGVRFHCRSPAGDEGHPGVLDCGVQYRLDDEGALCVDYRATADTATIVDLATQIFFNLKDAGRSSVLDYELWIAADEFVEIDRDGIPTGHLCNVEGTSFDFRNPNAVRLFAGASSAAISASDPCYVLDRLGTTPRTVARVRDPETGRGLEVATTQPGLRLALNRTSHPDQASDARGLCLSPQNFPDAPNQRHFPSATLEPEREYRQTTVYRFLSGS